MNQALPEMAAMARDEEALLVSRAQRGSSEAFRVLVDAYKDRLCAFAWRMVRDHHEAEDIAQTAFVRAYENLASYSDKYAFSTWLYTIAYRLCLNHVRRRRPHTGDVDMSRIGGVEEASAEIVASTEEARRLRDAIWTAVDGLKDVQKAAVLLFYREGKSCEEIGHVLGVPSVTVKSHLHRARARLRDVLQAEVVDDWQNVRFGNQSRGA